MPADPMVAEGTLGKPAPMRITTISGAVVVMILAASAPARAAERGTLLRGERMTRLSRSQTARQVARLTLPVRQVRHGVDAFRLRYATVGVGGAPTSASGLLVLPRVRARRLRTVSYAHGTMVVRADAPSRSLDSLAGASALLFAGAGFATVAPDYLGLGDGPGRHPLVHAASEATASLDMLRAARTFAARHHRVLDTDTLVTGFSQGGHAAMALGHLLQAGADSHLKLRALAPMSGPYDIERAELPAMLDGRLDPATSNYYISYLMRSWQPIYHVFDRPDDVWKGPWAGRVARLFDGRHDDVATLKRLPRRLSQLFTPAFRARLAHPDGGLAAGLRADDTTCDWRPRVPVRLYGARRDRQVAFANSQHCATRLRVHGAHPRLIDVGAVDHFPSTLSPPRASSSGSRT
jgi:hypothetical protein